jgi:phytanoyl-CoA hydroxylase
MLNPTLLADYERDGFIRISGFIKPSDLQQLRERIDHYTRERLAQLPAGDRVLEADGKAVRNLFRMQLHDPYFLEFAQREEILSIVAPLVHGKPVLKGVETFNKPAKVGSGVPPHQDNAYFCQNPPDVLTVWIAIDAATMENGPIYYIKGTHKLGLLPHKKSGITGNSMGLAEMPTAAESDKFCGTLQPGDALIHHCQTIHYSAQNKSDYPRCGFLLVYRGEHTRTDPEKEAQYKRVLTGV